MKEIFIETQLGQVYGHTAGDPTHPLVLGIHGWSQRNGWHTWEALMEPLAAASFYVVSVDMPGWGKSAPVNEPLRGEKAVAAARAILDGLQVGKAVLMGKSWGGGVALNLALAHPARVSKLILTAPAFSGAMTGLRQLTQPVLMAWAEDDPVIPIRYASQYQNVIPNMQLETYPTGGHNAAMKNAAAFAPLAIQFLKT